MTLPLTPLVALPTAIDAGDWSGAEYPLGAHYDPAASATTFAVAAPWATRVILELFSRPVGVDALSQVDLDRGPDGIWRARLANVGPGAHYGYRVWGPGWDISPDWRPGNSSAGFTADVGPNGERFNPNKVLTDPYAREISHSPASPEVTETDADAAIFGFGPQDYRGRPVREWDTARVAPKAIVIHDTTPVGNRPQVPTESTTTYEAHVRNLTLHPSARPQRPISPPCRLRRRRRCPAGTPRHVCRRPTSRPTSRPSVSRPSNCPPSMSRPAANSTPSAQATTGPT